MLLSILRPNGYTTHVFACSCFVLEVLVKHTTAHGRTIFELGQTPSIAYHGIQFAAFSECFIENSANLVRLVQI